MHLEDFAAKHGQICSSPKNLNLDEFLYSIKHFDKFTNK